MEFNAEVAAWNLKRAMGEKSKRKEYLGFVGSVEVLDEYKIKINLKYPTAIVLVNLSRAVFRPIHIVSKAAVEKHGEDFGRNPVGTGPFKLKEWKAGDYVELERWENYWKAGEPKLDSLKFRFIPEASVNVLELEAGSVDLIFNLSAYDIPKLKARPELVIQDVPWTGRMTAFGWNAWFYFMLPFSVIGLLLMTYVWWRTRGRDVLAG